MKTVGDDDEVLEVGALLERLRDGERGRADVEQNALAGADQRCRDPADGAFVVCGCLQRLLETRLAGSRGTRHRPSVDPADVVAVVEGGKVATHGHFADGEDLRQLGHPDEAAPGDEVGHPFATHQRRNGLAGVCGLLRSCHGHIFIYFRLLVKAGACA